MKWYVERDGAAEGPLTTEEALSLLREMGSISSTLVWREQLDDWQAAACQPEFASAFGQRPPPLPSRTPASVGATVDVPLVSGFEGAQSEPSSLELIPLLPPTPGSPWSRFCARQIDLVYLGYLGLAGSEFVAIIAFPNVAEAFAQMSYVGAGVLGVLIACLLNAVVVCLFGNSLGKWIFGLRAVPADIGWPANAFWIFGRELRVWWYGLCAGMPILSLITMRLSYGEVAAGRPACYDIGRAMVLERPIGRPRRAVAMLVTLFFLFGTILIGTLAERTRREATTLKPWLNPLTDSVAQLPGGWSFDPANSSPAASLYAFSDALGTTAIFLAAERTADTPIGSIDLPSYGQALERSLKSSVSFKDRWVEHNLEGRSMLLRSGTMTTEGWPASYAIWIEGETVWRIVGISSSSSRAPELVDMPAAVALLRSVPRR